MRADGAMLGCAGEGLWQVEVGVLVNLFLVGAFRHFSLARGAGSGWYR